MQELENTEMMLVEGGSTLGNLLIAAGGIIITVGTGGTAGVVAGVAITAVGFIGSL